MVYSCHTAWVYLHFFVPQKCWFIPRVAGANVLAADEEGETCLHLAFARHTATVNLDQADAIQQVPCKATSIFHSAVTRLCYIIVYS